MALEHLALHSEHLTLHLENSVLLLEKQRLNPDHHEQQALALLLVRMLVLLLGKRKLEKSILSG